MKLDVFISGEIIDLCIPTKEFAQKSDWYSWVNDPKISRYLYQGLFPNTPENQVDFFESQKDKRIILIISNKKDYLGVISLSYIDLVNKKASVAILINPRVDFFNSSMIALEAMARITEHAFKNMGLNRIWAGQHIKLSGWQQRMELLGYRAEGILVEEFVKGREISDVIWIAATNKDYLRIVEERGKYWDSAEKMGKRIECLPKDKFIERLNYFFQKDGRDYYDKVFKL